MNPKTLVLGGVRSGKSRMAERLALETGLPVTYIATATASDDEMTARIDAHRRHRPKSWTVVEEPFELVAVLETHAAPNQCLLVDCLTLWLTNMLTTERADTLEHERLALIELLPKLSGPIIMVSNETNMGVMPMGALSRRYCDEAGVLHQDLAQVCDNVILTVAGLPHFLKGERV